jgi:hypothetical protein
MREKCPVIPSFPRDAEIPNRKKPKSQINSNGQTAKKEKTARFCFEF